MRLAKARLQLAQAVAEDVGEAQQQRQLGAVGARGIDHLGQRDRRALRAARLHADAARGVDVEIAFRPVRDRVGLAGLVGRPGGHGRVRRKRQERHSNVGMVRGPLRRSSLQSAPCRPAAAARRNPMTDTSWHYENFEPAGSAIGYRITRKLDEVQSPFQKIEIFETHRLGQPHADRRRGDADHARQLPLPRDDVAPGVVHACRIRSAW